MRNPLICSALGISASGRRRRLRENALRQAERRSSEGVPTRIPFLKKALCGIEITPPPPARQFASPQPPFVVKTSIGPLIDPRSSLAHVARLNETTYDDGLQYVPVRKYAGELARFEQRRCSTEFEGDLKYSTVLDEDSKVCIMNGASYHDHIFQVFISPRGNDLSETKAHEREHAIHMSLWGMAGLHHRLLPVFIREYLAMLAAMIGADGHGLIGESRIMFRERIKTSTTRPYGLAAKLFELQLRAVHGFSKTDIDLAMGALMFPDESRPYQFELLQRLKACGKSEYSRMYLTLFGIGREDIQEVVSKL